MWSPTEDTSGAGFVKDDPNKADGKGGNSEAKGRRSLMPVNSQILRSLCVTSQSSLIVHRQKIQYASLVGQIGKLDITSAKVDLTIIDSYGAPVEVLFWQGEDRCQNLAPDMFVEVVGTPREVNNGTGLYAFSIHPVTDFAQVINHNLEVILYSKALEKMKNNFLAQQNLDIGCPNYVDPTLAPLDGQPTNVYRDSYTAPSQPAASNASAPKPANGGPLSTKDLGRKVLDYLEKDAPEQGAHIDSIRAALKFDAATINKVMEYLSSEGHVYTTTDDEHYKSTEG